MTQIHILNQDINVAFNMATLIAYESITDKAYNPDDLHKTENHISLLYAAIIAANRGTTVEMDDLLQNASHEDIRILDEAVSKEMLAFYKIPTPAKIQQQESSEEDLSKNV